MEENNICNDLYRILIDFLFKIYVFGARGAEPPGPSRSKYSTLMKIYQYNMFQ